MPTNPNLVNVAARLQPFAIQQPDAVAIVEPGRYDRSGQRQYQRISFAELEQDSNRIAAGLMAMGVRPGTRLALLVRPGIDFVSLVFALFKAGVVVILIDPGMGRKNLIRCLEDARPEGFVAIPPVHAVRTVLRHRFRDCRFNVTVGRRWFWGGTTLAALRRTSGEGFSIRSTGPDDPAAIIFTTGSTGPPKGVEYLHGHFDGQVEQIRDFYGIEPGEVDLPGFPLFGLFNCAMGVTTVIPDMDPTRPARVDPTKIIEAITDWNVTQTFGSPAIWNRVGRYCQDRDITLPTVRRVLSAGAPVPADVLERMKGVIHPEGDIHTPYGATEALPVASIAASEVLAETAAQTAKGAGVCVGRRFPGIDWRVIRIIDGPIQRIDLAEPLPEGEIGELIVRGTVVTRRYVTRVEANATGKIPDGVTTWHRMGDVGYLDARDRFWFCGRMAHRVQTPAGTMYSVPCEAICNTHPDVYRSALVGVGEPGSQQPVMIVEPHEARHVDDPQARDALLEEIRRLAQTDPRTARIEHFLVHRSFPVDIRHNAKIFRERLGPWAAGLIESGVRP